MEQVFEAWCETLLGAVAQRVGGQLQVGRLNQTRVPLAWKPTSRGTLRFLLPDLILKTPTATLVVDAKYKHFWEHLQVAPWQNFPAAIQETHRADLHQVLAHASTCGVVRKTACLLYPCEPDTWKALYDNLRGGVRATLSEGCSPLEVILAAVPLGYEIAPLRDWLSRLLLLYLTTVEESD